MLKIFSAALTNESIIRIGVNNPANHILRKIQEDSNY
jgi:hypothetical protein